MNRSNTSASSDTLHIILDVINMAITLLVTYLVWKPDLEKDEAVCLVTLVFVHILVFILSNKTQNVYNVTLFFYLDRVFRKVTWSFILATFTGYVVYRFAADRALNVLVIFTYAVLFYALTLCQVLFFRDFVDKFVRRKNLPRTLYVGSKDSYNKFRYFMRKTTIQCNEIGFVSLYDEDMQFGYLGTLSELEELIRKYNIDQVYIMQKREHDIVYIQKYIDLCIEMGVTCRIVVDIYRRRKSYSYVSSVGTYPVITYHTVNLNTYERIIKRFMDMAAAIVGIVITSPIMIITAIAIKIDSPGPALFKQVRVGQNGRHFKIWKFRSMYTDAEKRKAELREQNQVSDGMMFKIKDDPRITRVGKIIRKLSIDELPQFFNVLFGSMSLVGTRPPTIDEVDKYQTSQWRRISIKPGITGMWQVSGRSNITDFDEVVRLDTEYIDNWSLWLDIKIIFKTIVVLFQHKDAY